MTPRQSLRVAAKVDRGAPSVQHPESSALAGGCQVTPPDLKCQVCDAPAIGVASSSLGPISFAYCAECAHSGAEPYWFTVGYVAELCGDTPEAIADWFKPVVEATAQRAGKTVDQFWADVRAYEPGGAK